MHHNVFGQHGAARVMMAPAPKGTGIIAGGPMRAVFEVMGITDIVAKSHGSTNPYNMVRATFDALRNSTTPVGSGGQARQVGRRDLHRLTGATHMANQQKTVKVQLVRSPIGTKESHRATVRGLGLRKLNSVSELQDTPAVRGMINKIDYLVQGRSEGSRWNSITSSRPTAPSITSAASVVASAPAWARPPAVATRARSPVRAATTRSASKAARCRCSVACRSAASSRSQPSSTPKSRLAALERLRRRPKWTCWR